MAKINGQSPQVAQQKVPWEDGGPQSVRGLRRAITNREEEIKVSNDVAPLMAELLTRIDAFTEPDAPRSLNAPKSPGPGDPPDDHQMMVSLGHASSKIADDVQATGDETARQRLLGLLHVVEDHLDMKREVLMRAGSNDLG